MSVLMVVAVTPSNGSKPYVIMGSDTKKIAFDFHKDEKIETNDFNGKVREVNGKLVGVVGQIPNEFLNEYLQIMSNDDKNLESLTLDIFELAKKVISNADYEGAKLGIFLAAIENGCPSVGIINVDKTKLGNANYKTSTAKEGHLLASNFDSFDDLEKEINDKIGKNQKFETVRKYVGVCLKAAASRLPETCNQKIDIKQIGK